MSSLFDKFSSRTLSVSSSVIPEILGSPALAAVSISGTEAVDSLFNYQIVLKTPDSLNHLISETTNFNTEEWRGQEMSVQIQLEGNGMFVAGQMGNAGMGNIGSGIREINGIIDDAKFLRVEGRHAYYEVSLKPWLYEATLTTDCKIYQNKTVKEIIDEALSSYTFSIEWRLIDEYPKRDYTTQFNESTFDFVSRLCETWGVTYFFEHGDGKHRLIFTDYMGGYRPNSSMAYQTVLFHTPNAKIDEEYIDAFVPANRLTSCKFTSKDFDYTRPRANLTVSKEDPDSDHNQREVYEWHSPHSGHNHYAQPKAGPNQATNEPQNEGQFLARIRMEQLHCQGYRAYGSGHLKGMQPGHSFKLTEHPRSAANIEYLILSTTLTITEVAQETQRPGNPHGQRHEVHLDFEAYPLRGAGDYRPANKTPIPKMYGLESAVVVGPNSQDENGKSDASDPNLWTDNLGRIKIQFLWDRLGKDDQNSSCWVRVSSPWAGNQLGGIHIPRIGQEVLIAFISGNPDLPVCTGRVYNQNNLPPWTLPSQQALSGFRSRELTADGGNAAGGRSNHLLMDDSEGKIQAQLKSDHQHSQLSLGYITRVENNQGRKDERGQGFELRTDGHGAIRAKDGLLITTEARPNAESYIKNINETIQRLTESRDLLEQIAGVAQHHQAQDSNADQSDVVKEIKAQNQAIMGDGKEQGEFTQPHLVLASPAGIASTTPQSTHIASGQHTQLTTGQHLSIATGGGWFASVVDKFALLVQKAGMKLVAAAGKISIQAQSGEIELIANKVLALISQSDWVDIKGKKGVRLHGANGMVEVSDQTQFFTASPVLFHGSLETLGPKSISQSFNAMPTSNFDQEVRLFEVNGKPAPKAAYDLMRPDGNILNSKTAVSGTTQLQKGTGMGRYTIRYKGELP